MGQSSTCNTAPPYLPPLASQAPSTLRCPLCFTAFPAGRLLPKYCSILLAIHAFKRWAMAVIPRRGIMARGVGTAERPLETRHQSLHSLPVQDLTIVACAMISFLTFVRVWLMFCGLFRRRAGHDETMASSNTVASTSVYHDATDDRNDRTDRLDRPIRPLPKRRLRERLSPEVADSIEYPPAPQSAPALFSYPCNLKGSSLEDDSNSSNREYQNQGSGRQATRRHRSGAEPESDETTLRRTVVPRPPTESLGRPSRFLQRPETVRQGQSPQPPPSAASSADGYDSFENTNNKKKRKIPTAGEMNGVHGLSDHGLNDAHSLPGGLAVTPDRSGENGNSTSVPYYGSGSFVSPGQNVSGPGRGRFGRTRSGRSPLQTLSDASGNWLGRGSKTRSATWSPQPGKSAACSLKPIPFESTLCFHSCQKPHTPFLRPPW